SADDAVCPPILEQLFPRRRGVIDEKPYVLWSANKSEKLACRLANFGISDQCAQCGAEPFLLSKHEFIQAWPGILEMARQEFPELTDLSLSVKYSDPSDVGRFKLAV